VELVHDLPSDTFPLDSELQLNTLQPRRNTVDIYNFTIAFLYKPGTVRPRVRKKRAASTRDWDHSSAVDSEMEKMGDLRVGNEHPQESQQTILVALAGATHVIERHAGIPLTKQCALLQTSFAGRCYS